MLPLPHSDIVYTCCCWTFRTIFWHYGLPVDDLENWQYFALSEVVVVTTVQSLRNASGWSTSLYCSFSKSALFWELGAWKFQVLFLLQLPEILYLSVLTLSAKVMFPPHICWESKLYSQFSQLILRHVENAWQLSAPTSNNNWFLPLPGEV